MTTIPQVTPCLHFWSCPVCRRIPPQGRCRATFRLPLHARMRSGGSSRYTALQAHCFPKYRRCSLHMEGISSSIPLCIIGGPVKSHSGYNPRVWTASTPPPAKIPSKRCWLHASGMLPAVKPLSIPTSTKATQGNWWTCVPKCLCQHNVMNWEWTSHQTPRTSCRVSWLSKTPKTRPAVFACSSPPSTLP